MAEFSQELFNEICERLASGESLRKICDDDDMPNKSNVFRWLDQNEELRDQYARARERQGDALFDDCLAIADKFDSTEMLEPEHINRARLRIDTRKWMAGKLRPKKYGDKLAVDSNVKAEVDVSVGVSPSDELQRYIDGIAERRGKTS